MAYYGNAKDFDKIQKVNIGAGRYFQQADFDRGTPYVVLGYRISERLFGKAEKGVGQTVKLKDGKTAIVIGIIEKQGQSLLGGWDYDNSILLTYRFLKQMFREENGDPKILVRQTRYDDCGPFRRVAGTAFDPQAESCTGRQFSRSTISTVSANSSTPSLRV